MRKITDTKSLEFENYMDNFTGTEAYHEYLGIGLTDGALAFAQKAEAFWFLDMIIPVLKKRNDYFISIKLEVIDSQANITMVGDNEEEFFNHPIGFTDCFEGEWTFFFENGILMYCREY